MQSNILRDYYDNNRCELSNRLLAQRQYLLVSSGFNCQCYKISRNDQDGQNLLRRKGFWHYRDIRVPTGNLRSLSILEVKPFLKLPARLLPIIGRCFQSLIVSTQQCRHSSVDSSAPSILPPQVQVPSTPSMLFQFILFKLYICHLN